MKRGVRELRIVGGSLRGRKWRFPEVEGLRPTPDRVRETLFNWLAPHIAGARVLDLFAGSGALGFEAMSRGARSATLIESNSQASAQLTATAVQFGLTETQVIAMDALQFLRQQSPAQFDIVFLDPPFAGKLLPQALEALALRKVLAAGGFCYVEQAANAPLPLLPTGWVLHRSGKAGEVGYHLLHEPTRHLPGHI
jgi:16S rRNA (guanine966-N2)-methyltransferase